MKLLKGDQNVNQFILFVNLIFKRENYSLKRDLRYRLRNPI
ncbi:MAG: hypothetical protein YK1309IOTA_340002 [Marine Group I thaumarchaeote]|nr:MAG: hypothetical protein YK1309IOTA_340002 [Marine Group I thaumarchaeote]